MSASATSRGPLRTWAARHHPIVWWLVVIKLTAIVAFSLLVPFYRGPDEVLHLSMMRWYADHPGAVDPRVKLPVDPGLLSIDVPQPSAENPVLPPLVAADATPRPDRPTLVELDAAVTGEGPATNQLSQHPALFSTLSNGVVGVVTGLLPADVWSWDRYSLVVRLQSAPLMALLPLIASSAALAAGLRRGGAAVAAAVAFAVPMTSFLGAVINSDGVVTVLAALGVASTLVFLTTRARRWAWAAVGWVALGVAMKSTMLPVLPWVVAVVALPVWWAWRARTSLRPHLVTLAGAIVIGLAGSSWQIANWFRYGNLQPSGYRLDVREDVPTSVDEFFREWVSRLSISFWAQPGRRSGVELPAVATSIATAVLVALVVVAVVVPLVRRRGRLVPVALAVLCAVQLALLGRTNWAGYFRGSGYEGFQGRYLFIVLVPLAVLAALGVREIVGTRRRSDAPGPDGEAPGRASGRDRELGVAVLFAAVGVAAHGWLAYVMAERYWGDPNAPVVDHLADIEAWSPLPVLLTRSVLVAPVVVVGLGVLWGLWALLRSGARRQPPDGAVHPLGEVDARPVPEGANLF